MSLFWPEDSSEELDEGKGVNKYLDDPDVEEGPTEVVDWDADVSTQAYPYSCAIGAFHLAAAADTAATYFDPILPKGQVFKDNQGKNLTLRFLHKDISDTDFATLGPDSRKIKFYLVQDPLHQLKLQPAYGQFAGTGSPGTILTVPAGTGTYIAELDINVSPTHYPNCWRNVTITINMPSSALTVPNQWGFTNYVAPLPNNINSTFIKAEDLNRDIYQAFPQGINIGVDGEIIWQGSNKGAIEFTLETDGMPRFVDTQVVNPIDANAWIVVEWHGHITMGVKNQASTWRQFILSSTGSPNHTHAQLSSNSRTLISTDPETITFSIGENMSGISGAFFGIWVMTYS